MTPHEQALDYAAKAHDINRYGPETALVLATLALFWQKESELNPTDEWLKARTEQAQRMAQSVAEWAEAQQ